MKIKYIKEGRTLNDAGVDKLVNAIITLGCEDYKKYVSRIARGIDVEENTRKKESIIKFIKSEWFSTLTDLEPDYLLKMLDKYKLAKVNNRRRNI